MSGHAQPSGANPAQANESESSELIDIDAVMARFARRIEALRVDLDRVTSNFDAWPDAPRPDPVSP
jgi:hypothetical protein